MNWADNIAKKWMGLRIAERASGLAGIRAAARSTRRLVRKTQDGTLGQPDEPMEDEESISIGDPQYHYHGQQQGQSNLLPMVLAAILGGFGAKYLPVFNSQEPAPPEATAGTDRVNEYELSIGTNDE